MSKKMIEQILIHISISNGSNKIKNKKETKDNNVAERLNNYGKFIKNKKKIERKIDNIKTRKANSINENRTRNKKDNMEPKINQEQNNKKNLSNNNKQKRKRRRKLRNIDLKLYIQMQKQMLLMKRIVKIAKIK